MIRNSLYHRHYSFHSEALSSPFPTPQTPVSWCKLTIPSLERYVVAKVLDQHIDTLCMEVHCRSVDGLDVWKQTFVLVLERATAVLFLVVILSREIHVLYNCHFCCARASTTSTTKYAIHWMTQSICLAYGAWSIASMLLEWPGQMSLNSKDWISLETDLWCTQSFQLGPVRESNGRHCRQHHSDSDTLSHPGEDKLLGFAFCFGHTESCLMHRETC